MPSKKRGYSKEKNRKENIKSANEKKNNVINAERENVCLKKNIVELVKKIEELEAIVSDNKKSRFDNRNVLKLSLNLKYKKKLLNEGLKHNENIKELNNKILKHDKFVLRVRNDMTRQFDTIKIAGKSVDERASFLNKYEATVIERENIVKESKEFLQETQRLCSEYKNKINELNINLEDYKQLLKNSEEKRFHQKLVDSTYYKQIYQNQIDRLIDDNNKKKQQIKYLVEKCDNNLFQDVIQPNHLQCMNHDYISNNFIQAH